MQYPSVKAILLALFLMLPFSLKRKEKKPRATKFSDCPYPGGESEAPNNEAPTKETVGKKSSYGVKEPLNTEFEFKVAEPRGTASAPADFSDCPYPGGPERTPANEVPSEKPENVKIYTIDIFSLPENGYQNCEQFPIINKPDWEALTTKPSQNSSNYPRPTDTITEEISNLASELPPTNLPHVSRFIRDSYNENGLPLSDEEAVEINTAYRNVEAQNQEEILAAERRRTVIGRASILAEYRAAIAPADTREQRLKKETDALNAMRGGPKLTSRSVKI